jgi:hypothetical protein
VFAKRCHERKFHHAHQLRFVVVLRAPRRVIIIVIIIITIAGIAAIGSTAVLTRLGNVRSRGRCGRDDGLTRNSYDTSHGMVSNSELFIRGDGRSRGRRRRGGGRG